MMHKLKILTLVFVLGLFHSCENDPILIPGDIAYVAFTKSAKSIGEEVGTAQIELYLTTLSTQRVECTITTSTEGLSAKAIEGTDFSIINKKVIFENGFGYVNLSIDIIDNEIFEGKKEFYLEISEATEGFQIGIDGKEKIRISIIDDEHPLVYFVGTYSHVGNSIWDGNTVWETTISTNPDNESQIFFKPLHPWNTGVQVDIVGTVNEADKTITLASAQKLTETGEGNYYWRLYSGENFNTNWEGDETSAPILGTYTVNPEKTEIIITLNEWGARWIEPAGTFDGRWWNDYFSISTLTKN